MGRSKRHDHLKCSRCYAAGAIAYERGHGQITWRNVEIVARQGCAVRCQCRTCGHMYLSRSAAAFRSARSLPK